VRICEKGRIAFVQNIANYIEAVHAYDLRAVIGQIAMREHGWVHAAPSVGGETPHQDAQLSSLFWGQGDAYGDVKSIVRPLAFARPYTIEHITS
jgi:hypothetical protein